MSREFDVIQVTPETRVGWVGTGVMGAAMCGHIMKAGFRHMTVYNRTKAKAQPLIDLGATWADTPKKVAEASDVVFTIVGFPADVREVYLGETGILAAANSKGPSGSPRIVVDMTTSPASLAREIAEVAAAKGVIALDAPVTGGDVGAKNGTLSIMVGGDEAALNAIRSLIEPMGKNIVYHGAPGSGQDSKMCNQIVIAGTMVGVCEALVYGKRAGLDLEKVLQSIGSGAAACFSLTAYWPRILKGDFNPGFFVEHIIKDMGIALEEARRMNLALPGLALVHQLYLATQAQGHGRRGTQSLVLALEQMSAKIEK